MTFWTYQNLADVTQGQWLVEPDDLSAQLTGLWHDTRDIKPGQAYLAIAGDNFDGHAFIDQAFNAGAALAIVSAQPSSLEGGAGGRVPSQPILKVADTVVALQDLARAYRDELSKGRCKVIGIAGSNGKTTTRHLIHHVLTHAGLKGTQSPKSFNNHLGVPLTLLQAKPSDDFVAAEIGTNHPGEIDFLSDIARPDIAVITSIGEEHLEFFGDLDGVAKEEACVLKHVADSGIALVQADAWQRIQEAVTNNPPTAIEIYGFNSKNEDDRAAGLWIARGHREGPKGGFVVSYLRDEIEGVFHLPGDYNLQNAGAAIGVGVFMGVGMNSLVKALASVTAPDQRGQVHRFGSGVTVIDDAYNANPTSMRIAIDLLNESAGNSVAILGDMFELGEASAAKHHEMAHYRSIKENTSTLFECRRMTILIGEAFSGVKVDLDPDLYDYTIHQLKWSDRTPGDVAALLEPGDTVLLKASRGMRLERLIPAIERRFGPAEGDEPT